MIKKNLQRIKVKTSDIITHQSLREGGKGTVPNSIQIKKKERVLTSPSVMLIVRIPLPVSAPQRHGVSLPRYKGNVI